MWKHIASQHTGHMEGIHPTARECLTLAMGQVLFGKSCISSSISPMLCGVNVTISGMIASYAYRAVYTVCVSVYIEY